jgi:uncharacterized protein YecE (DUF72 family)
MPSGPEAATGKERPGRMLVLPRWNSGFGKGFPAPSTGRVWRRPDAAMHMSRSRECSLSAVLVGTSGWTYDSWRGPFYPPDLAKKDWLRWYGTQFPTTEVNGSFYRTPSTAAVREWRDSTPPGFVFAWKASKFITHWKRLKDTCANSIALMETRLEILGEKLGPVLFQLPVRFEADRERLARFLEMLPPGRRYAFEFRHPSWYDHRILDLLADHDASLCLADHHLAPAPWVATAGHVYVRGHGPDGRYRDNYPDATLRAWARRIRAWQRAGRRVFVYFDNDQKSAAPADARRLMTMLETRSRRSSGNDRRAKAQPSDRERRARASC